ncbi:hypothetical protein [Nostoc sp. PA-18-2419]|nr:hypothetical protein [Nostoc sp. PA-18-2419]
MDAHEIENLDIQALDVQELERRLELATAAASPAGWEIFGPNEPI